MYKSSRSCWIIFLVLTSMFFWKAVPFRSNEETFFFSWRSSFTAGLSSYPPSFSTDTSSRSMILLSSIEYSKLRLAALPPGFVLSLTGLSITSKFPLSFLLHPLSLNLRAIMINGTPTFEAYGEKTLIKRVKQRPAPSYSYHRYEKSSYVPLKIDNSLRNGIPILKLIKTKTIAKLKYCKIVILTNIVSVSTFLDLCFSHDVSS